MKIQRDVAHNRTPGFAGLRLNALRTLKVPNGAARDSAPARPCAGRHRPPERLKARKSRTHQRPPGVDEGIWLASFMHCDLGYFDLEQKTLQPLDNPFGTRLSPMS
ncbi:MAG: hypothetical protein E6G85_01880 [Alphaproteobacteria bacterium]|nr:MAG: hypothetical protein E6G85_01880 [Alphaproteobacteria bacterium]